MTFTVKEVIAQARIRLADSNGQQWPNERVIYLFNEGLEEIALRSRLFVRRGYVPVRNAVPFYNLSSKVLKLSRVAYKDDGNDDSINIPFLSHSQMDELGQRGGDRTRNRRGEQTSPYGDFGLNVGIGWDNDTGPEPLAVVVSNQQPGNFRLYPIPTFQEAQANTAAVPLASSGAAGVIRGPRALQAHAIDTFQSDALMPFGVTNTNLPPRYLIIHYIEVPDRAALSGTALPDKTYDYNTQYRKPLENYIVAKALRDDNDSYDAEKANREWAYFLSSMETLEDQRSNDFRSSTTVNLSPNWIG